MFFTYAGETPSFKKWKQNPESLPFLMKLISDLKEYEELNDYSQGEYIDSYFYQIKDLIEKKFSSNVFYKNLLFGILSYEFEDPYNSFDANILPLLTQEYLEEAKRNMDSQTSVDSQYLLYLYLARLEVDFESFNTALSYFNLANTLNASNNLRTPYQEVKDQFKLTRAYLKMKDANSALDVFLKLCEDSNSNIVSQALEEINSLLASRKVTVSVVSNKMELFLKDRSKKETQFFLINFQRLKQILSIYETKKHDPAVNKAYLGSAVIKSICLEFALDASLN